MSSIPRVLFAFYAAALAALFLIGAPLAIGPVAASPVPFPLVTYFAREYVANPAHNSHLGNTLVKDAFTNSSELTSRRTNGTSLDARDIDTTIKNIGILNTYYTQMSSHSANLSELGVNMHYCVSY